MRRKTSREHRFTRGAHTATRMYVVLHTSEREQVLKIQREWNENIWDYMYCLTYVWLCRIRTLFKRHL